MVDYKLIGKRIKEKRQTAKLTQEKLSELLSVTVGYISQVERGITKVNLSTLSEIAAILNTDISYLITGVMPDGELYLTKEISEKYNKLTDKQKAMLHEIIDTLIKYNDE